MGLLNYAAFHALNEGIQGDLTLPALTKAKPDGNFSYQVAIDKASGGEKAMLENEALFLQSVLETRGNNVKLGTLGEYMTAAVFGGQQTNTHGDANTIFYDVVLDNAYYSVKTSFARDSNTPTSCLGSSRLKRNNVLSIFSSAGANLNPVDSANYSKFALDLYDMCEGRKKVDGSNDKFGFSLVYIRDNKFQIFLSNAVTKTELLKVITKQWDSIKKSVKVEINESNVVKLFLDAILPADDKDRLKDSWSPQNIIKYFGGEETATTIDITVASPIDRRKVLAYISNLGTDVLANFAKSQGYTG